MVIPVLLLLAGVLFVIAIQFTGSGTYEFHNGRISNAITELVIATVSATGMFLFFAAALSHILK